MARAAPQAGDDGDRPMTASVERFVRVEGRGIAALLHPRPVYLISACGPDGITNVATVAWVTPLSHTPPLVGLSVRPSSRTGTLIAESGEFVVNVVDTSMCSAVRYCGNAANSGTDKAAALGLELVRAEEVAPPRLGAALGWLECRVERRIEVGDHALFVARVLVACAREGFDDAWDPESAPVLQCLAHDRFGRLTETDTQPQGAKRP